MTASTFCEVLKRERTCVCVCVCVSGHLNTYSVLWTLNFDRLYFFFQTASQPSYCIIGLSKSHFPMYMWSMSKGLKITLLVLEFKRNSNTSLCFQFIFPQPLPFLWLPASYLTVCSNHTERTATSCLSHPAPSVMAYLCSASV